MFSNAERQKRFYEKSKINNEVRAVLPPELQEIYFLGKNYCEEDLRRVQDVLNDYKSKSPFRLSSCFDLVTIEKYFGLANVIIFNNKDNLQQLIIALIFLGLKYRLLKLSLFKLIIKNLQLDISELKEIFNLMMFNNNINYKTLKEFVDYIQKKL